MLSNVKCILGLLCDAAGSMSGMWLMGTSVRLVGCSAGVSMAGCGSTLASL